MNIYLFSLTCLGLVFTTSALTTSTSRVSQKVIFFPKDAEEHIFQTAQKCANGTDVYKYLNTVEEGKYRDEDDFRNFIHCTYKNSGYTREDGSINIDVSAKIFPDPIAMSKVMKECDQTRGTSPVDNTFIYFKCFQNNTPFLIGFHKNS